MYVEFSMSTIYIDGGNQPHYHYNHKYLIHLLVPLYSVYDLPDPPA